MRKGFEPLVPGFRQVPFNDLEAVRQALSPATAAILIKGIQGEGGITPATPEYLLGLRRLCDEKRLLLLIDAVQCGHYRSGRFQSFQRILEGLPAREPVPDGVSMAKSLGGGFPMGAISRWAVLGANGVALCPTCWGRAPTGRPSGEFRIGCAMTGDSRSSTSSRPELEAHMRRDGRLAQGRPRTAKAKISRRRALGPRPWVHAKDLEFQPKDHVPALGAATSRQATQVVNRLHEAGVLTIPTDVRSSACCRR